MEETRPASYWLLADDRLDLGRSPELLSSFKAHFKHAALFNTALVISDSYAVNNYNFRYCLKHDHEFQQLVKDQVLRIACRLDEHGNPSSMVSIRDNMGAKKRPKEFTRDEYDANEDLELLDNHAPTMAYALPDVSGRYATKVLDVLRSGKGVEYIGSEHTRDAVLKLVQDECGTDTSTGEIDLSKLAKSGRAFFHYLKEAYVKATGNPWEEIEYGVTKVADAPYLTALPSVLELSPIYAPQHKGSFDIVRGGRGGKSEVVDEFKFATKLGLHSFVRGLELLTCDDVHRLCETDEAKNLFAIMSDGKRQVDSAEIKVAVHAYQNRIEDQIISRYSVLRAESADGSEKTLQFSFDGAADTVADAGSFLSMVFASPWLNVLGLVLTKPFRKAIKQVTGIEKAEKEAEAKKLLLAAEKQQAKDMLIAEFVKDEVDARIDAAGYWGSQGKEVLYRDIK